jgi:2-dehydro-3-deoxyphosphogluconate aldolase/(4S)-4-hydroxy-2-oxoglutarate aldolase
MTKEQIIHGLLNPGVVAIIRADDSEQLIHASRALIEGGVSAVEITMTTPNALQVIADLCRAFGDKVLAGVGTVMDAKTAEAAFAIGAEYVVTPVLRPDVIAACNRAGKPILSGSYTPTEAQTAYELGADFIKLFPSDTLGPKFIQTLHGPLPHLNIIPTGGVDLDTVGDYIKAGCVAVGVGGSLLSKEMLKNKDWAEVTDQAAKFVAAVAKARSK